MHQQRKCSVLVVDDDRDFRLLVKSILSPMEFLVEEAEDGEVAVRLLRDRSFDTLIIDLVMPKREGLETILAVGKQCSHRPRIIAVSGVTDRKIYLRAARLMGADLVLEKPINRAVLLQSMAETFNLRAAPTG